jgi:hypothetical protein
MESATSRHFAYMLRLWQVDGETPVWRASLEDAHTGERHGFGSLEQLFRFLTEQFGGSAETGDDPARQSDQEAGRRLR